MQGMFAKGSILSFLIFLSVSCFAQDSSTYKWNCKSRKIGEGKYELIFSTDSTGGCQLYAPNQDLGGARAVELTFPDSGITIENSFTEAGPSKTFVSSIFKDTVKVYERQTEWKVPISIIGKVPAKLQGKLSYFFGKGDDVFKPESYRF